MQEKRNSSALAMELHLSCTNPSIYGRCKRLKQDPKLVTHTMKSNTYSTQVIQVFDKFDIRWLWNPRTVMMPTSSSLAAPEVVAMTTAGAVIDDKVDIMMLIMSSMSGPKVVVITRQQPPMLETTTKSSSGQLSGFNAVVRDAVTCGVVQSAVMLWLM